MQTLIVDTRERSPWDAMTFNKKVQKLDEGDYTLEEFLEYEKQTGKKTIRIERKASVTELATNLGKLYVPFEKEMKRLQVYDEKYIVCEFTLADLARYPEGSNIPEKNLYRINKYGKKVKNIKMTGKFMQVRLDYLYREYDVSIIYAGSRANAINIMTELLNEYTKKIGN
jgi:hypothetical protein